MKKVILMVALLAATFAVQAQNNEGTTAPQNNQGNNQRPPRMTPEQRAERFVAKLDSQVKLTPDERKSITTIVINHDAKSDQIRKEANGDMEKMKLAQQENKKAQHQEIKSVLTSEQNKLWEEARQQHQGVRKEQGE